MNVLVLAVACCLPSFWLLLYASGDALARPLVPCYLKHLFHFFVANKLTNFSFLMSDCSVNACCPNLNEDTTAALLDQFDDERAFAFRSSSVSSAMAGSSGRTPAGYDWESNEVGELIEVRTQIQEPVNARREGSPNSIASNDSSTLSFQDEEVQNINQHLTCEKDARLAKETRDQGQIHDQNLDQRSEEGDIGQDAMALTRSQTRKRARKPRTPAQTLNDSDDEPSTKRTLRERTVTQQHPYISEKTRFTMSKSKGRAVKDVEVDKAVMKEMNGKNVKTQARVSTSTRGSAKGKPLTTKRASTDSPTPQSSGGVPEVTDEFVLHNTILYVEVLGSEDKGAAPIPFSACSTLESLLRFVNETWVAHENAVLSSIRCFLHWKVCRPTRPHFVRPN